MWKDQEVYKSTNSYSSEGWNSNVQMLGDRFLLELPFMAAKGVRFLYCHRLFPLCRCNPQASLCTSLLSSHGHSLWVVSTLTMLLSLNHCFIVPVSKWSHTMRYFWLGFQQTNLRRRDIIHPEVTIMTLFLLLLKGSNHIEDWVAV